MTGETDIIVKNVGKVNFPEYGTLNTFVSWIQDFYEVQSGSAVTDLHKPTRCFRDASRLQQTHFKFVWLPLWNFMSGKTGHNVSRSDFQPLHTHTHTQSLRPLSYIEPQKWWPLEPASGHTHWYLGRVYEAAFSQPCRFALLCMCTACSQHQPLTPGQPCIVNSHRHWHIAAADLYGGKTNTLLTLIP